jgi:Fe-S-cluster containining protein
MQASAEIAACLECEERCSTESWGVGTADIEPEEDPALLATRPPEPEYTDRPECRACGGKCCQKFTLNDYSAEAKKSIAENFPMFHAVPDEPGWYTCDRFVDGQCSKYDERPALCRNFPYPGEISVQKILFAGRLYPCPLSETLWHERFADSTPDPDVDRHDLPEVLNNVTEQCYSAPSWLYRQSFPPRPEEHSEL